MKEKTKPYLEGLATGIVLVIFINSVVNILVPRLVPFGQRELNFDTKLNTIYSIIDTYYVEDYEKSDLEEGMFLGMVYGLGDRYSSYMDPDTFQYFMEQTEGTYAGIGASVQLYEFGGVLIVQPYRDGPAYLAGIEPGDVITKVNGLDITNTDLDVVVSMMKGEPGTSVELTVYRESESKTFETQVTRAIVDIPTVEHEMLEGDIGRILLTGFERVTYNQFVEALEDLKTQGMKGLIIDIRNNPGGLLETVVKICDIILPEGIIVYTEDKDGNQEFHYSKGDQLEIPYAVLVNGRSASASEVLSGAVKDYGSGLIIGEQTFGKGVVQNIYPLSDGSAVKVTIARYYTPNGICIHGEGVAPDYVVPMDSDLANKIASLTYEKDTQLQKAVEILSEQMAEN